MDIQAGDRVTVRTGVTPENPDGTLHYGTILVVNPIKLWVRLAGAQADSLPLEFHAEKPRRQWGTAIGVNAPTIILIERPEELAKAIAPEDPDLNIRRMQYASWVRMMQGLAQEREARKPFRIDPDLLRELKELLSDD